MAKNCNNNTAVNLTETLAIPERRSARIAVSVLFFLQGFCFASWASRIPDIQLKLGLSEAALGLVLLGIPIGLLASLPFSGWLVTKLEAGKL